MRSIDRLVYKAAARPAASIIDGVEHSACCISVCYFVTTTIFVVTAGFVATGAAFDWGRVRGYRAELKLVRRGKRRIKKLSLVSG